MEAASATVHRRSQDCTARAPLLRMRMCWGRAVLLCAPCFECSVVYTDVCHLLCMTAAGFCVWQAFDALSSMSDAAAAVKCLKYRLLAKIMTGNVSNGGLVFRGDTQGGRLVRCIHCNWMWFHRVVFVPSG